MLILYTFTCDHCEHVFEELVNRDTKEHSCPKCDEIAKKTIMPVRFECGRGIDPDFPTAYAKWPKQRKARVDHAEKMKREHGAKEL